VGAGLLFWGVAEPVSHLVNPPYGALTSQQALAITFLHWAVHPWAIYATGGLVLAYFCYQDSQPMLPAAAFARWMPRKGQQSINAFALVSLMLGMSASLAQGTLQLYSGIFPLIHDLLSCDGLYLAIVVALALVYGASVITRLDRGIKYLSLLTLILSFILLAFLFYAGPAGFRLQQLWEGTLAYAGLLPEAAFGRIESTRIPNWSNDWTVTYFLSWIAWVPFVGIFIARISYGRTIREFLCGVMLIPSAFSMLWLATMGGAAFNVQKLSEFSLGAIVLEKPSQALFIVLDYYPWPEITVFLVLILVFFYLVTSADSASYVMAMIAEDGNETPSVPMRLLWGGILALLTFGVLQGGDGIHSVRALFSIGAIIMFVILTIQALSLLRHIKKPSLP
jgi:glycine betaine transporter